MSELARSGKGVYILAVSVEGNWNESMHHKEYTRRGHSQFSITYDLHTERVKTDMLLVAFNKGMEGLKGSGEDETRG
jgi:hypothetical protein